MRKLLCILELENTFLMTYPLRSQTKVFGNDYDIKKPDFTKDGIGIHFRKGREDVLEDIMRQVQIVNLFREKLTTNSQYGLPWIND